MKKRNRKSTTMKKIRNIKHRIYKQNPQSLSVLQIVTLCEGLRIKNKKSKYYEKRRNDRKKRIEQILQAIKDNQLKAFDPENEQPEEIDAYLFINKHHFRKWINEYNINIRPERETFWHWINTNNKPNPALDARHKDFRESAKFCCEEAGKLWSNDSDKELKIIDVTNLLYKELKSKGYRRPRRKDQIRRWLRKCKKNGQLSIPEYASKPGAPKKQT